MGDETPGLRELRDALLDKVARDREFCELIEHTAGTDQLDALSTADLVEVLRAANTRAHGARDRLNAAHDRFTSVARKLLLRLYVGLSIGLTSIMFLAGLVLSGRTMGSARDAVIAGVSVLVAAAEAMLVVLLDTRSDKVRLRAAQADRTLRMLSFDIDRLLAKAEPPWTTSG